MKAKPKVKAIAKPKVRAIARLNPRPPATKIIGIYLELVQKMEHRVSILESQVKALSEYNNACARSTERFAKNLKLSKTIKPKDLPDIKPLFKQ